jgi:hypothetical protein
MFTITACEKDLPMTAEQPATISTGKVTILKVKDELLSGLDKVFATKTIIDDDGGTIVVGDYSHGICYLSFPEDAINEKLYPNGTTIAFYWESNSLLEAEFYPDGIQFDEPVYIRLSYLDADLTGVNEDDLGIYYHNPDTGNWELISNQVNTSAKYVEGYINHFSRYAIGMD